MPICRVCNSLLRGLSAVITLSYEGSFWTRVYNCVFVEILDCAVQHAHGTPRCIAARQSSLTR